MQRIAAIAIITSTISSPTRSFKVLNELEILSQEGVSPIKIYMTDEALKLDDRLFLDVYTSVASRVLRVWCTPITQNLEERQLFAPRYYTAFHPPVAEVEATYRAISLSEFMDQPILIVHVSQHTAAEHI